MLRRLSARLAGLPQPARWGLGLAALIVGFNLLGVAVDSLYGGAPPGPTSSSYTTDSGGTAAYAELLERTDRTVERLRSEPEGADLDPESTLLVLSPPEVADGDALALEAFVRDGGRLVVAVDAEPAWLDDVASGAPTWQPGGSETSQALVPVEETRGVETTSGAGVGSWADANSSLPIVGGSSIAASVIDLGEGRIVFLADPTILHNARLDEADNAAFGLAIAGDRRSVLFAETFHGYTEATGLGALPSRARWTLLLLCVGVALAMLAYGRRFGPPDRPQRDFPPARRVYVDALAASLAKVNDRQEVVAPLRARARAALARRVNVSESADDEALVAAAKRHGVEEETEVLLKPVRDDEDVVWLGRTAIRTIRGMR